MTRIDRYIVSEFGRVFLICFVTFLGLFVITDFVNNLDELINHGKSHGGLPRVLLGFYGPKVPWFFDLISRIVALVAAIFAITSLQKNNEMAAMMAAGISRWRIVKPLILSVLVIAILGAANREFVLPNLGSSMTRDARNMAGEDAEELVAQYDHASGIYFDGSGIIPATQMITEPTLTLPANLVPRGTKIKSKAAKYFKRSGKRPSGILMTDVFEDLPIRHSLMDGEEKVVVYHPRDVDWLEEGQLFVPTDLPFAQLQEGANWRQFASTFSLISNARNESLDSGADVSVSIHRRLLQPVMDMVVLFLGIPVVLSREAQNAFVAVGSCMLVVAIFVIATLASHSMGMSYMISPSMAVWLPLLVFIPIASWISEPLRR